jgi:hypothetical protein
LPWNFLDLRYLKPFSQIDFVPARQMSQASAQLTDGGEGTMISIPKVLSSIRLKNDGARVKWKEC